jgi:hypothetical protein
MFTRHETEQVPVFRNVLNCAPTLLARPSVRPFFLDRAHLSSGPVSPNPRAALGFQPGLILFLSETESISLWIESRRASSC